MAVREAKDVISQNIIKWNIPQPTQKYKVVIHCSTYNHEKYIEDALKGFIMQKTNFPFCAIVVDDCSTDGTADIVRKYAAKYPDIIKPICLGYNHMQHGLSRNPYFERWHEAAEYMAQCEGDDYWIDSLKLKKQVDFLDVNFDYSMCFHNAEIYNLCNSKLKFKIVENRDYSLKELYDDWIVPTASVIYRKGCESGVIKGDDRIINGDINLIMALSSNGRVRGMQESMSVYRLHNNGLTMSRSIEDNEMLQRKYIKHYKCLQEHYSQIPKNSFNRKMADVYINLGIELCKKYKISLFYYLLLALAYSPFRFMERIGNLFNQK